jgi:hypothetical protein
MKTCEKSREWPMGRPRAVSALIAWNLGSRKKFPDPGEAPVAPEDDDTVREQSGRDIPHDAGFDPLRPGPPEPPEQENYSD